MICVNRYFVFCAFEKMTPFFETSDDGIELLVVYVVIPFNTGEAVGHESYWVPFAVVSLL